MAQDGGGLTTSPSTTFGEPLAGAPGSTLASAACAPVCVIFSMASPIVATGRSRNSLTLSMTPPFAGAGAGAAAAASVLVFSASAIVLGTCAEGRRVHAKVADARARTIDRASRRAVAALSFPSMAWGGERVSRPPRRADQCFFFHAHRMCTLTLLVSVAWSRMRRRDESGSVRYHGGYRETQGGVKLVVC